jgi:uncharacterized membrane protein YfcA
VSGIPLAGWAGATLVVLVGSVLQGTVGFGLGMLAAPLLVLVDPRLVPGPLLAVAFLLTALMARREHQSIDFHGVGWALLGRVPGTLLGAATLLIAPKRGTALLVGVMVFVAVALVGSGASLTRSRRSLLGAGTLSGFMSTTASIGGPPVAVLYRDAAADRMRGTLASFFMFGLVLSIAALVVVGRFGLDELLAALVLFPGVLTGFLLSGRIAPKLDRSTTRRAVLVVSALAGASVIVEALLSAPSP